MKPVKYLKYANDSRFPSDLFRTKILKCLTYVRCRHDMMTSAPFPSLRGHLHVNALDRAGVSPGIVCRHVARRFIIAHACSLGGKPAC